MSHPAGMIFLEKGNAVIEEQLRRFSQESSKDPVNARMTDFDDCLMALESPSESSVITLSVKLKNAADIMRQGGQQVLEEQYGPYLTAATADYDAAIKADFSSLSEPVDAVIYKFAHFKRVLLGAPIQVALHNLRERKDPGPPMVVPYRQRETIYVVPEKERVAVIISVNFADATDRAIARVFMMEFVDVQRLTSNAPPVFFGREPPTELRGVETREDLAHESHVGYISFGVFPAHVSDDQKLDKAVSMLTGLRSYLLYHIKASKSYLHTRMRRYIVTMQQVLNRAVPEAEHGEKRTKTASGKTFVRR